MAVGNAIVNTAKFKPLTVAEWSAPLKEYSTQHAAMDEALAQLGTEAEEYERYIRENPNSEVAQLYNDYINSIDEQARQLALNGISPQSRTDLLSLRRKYSNSVKPIKQAVTTYQDIMTQRNKDINKGIIGAPDITVGYLLEHPEYTVTQDKESYHTGENIYKAATDMFKGLNQFDTTPIYEMSEDGKFVNITVPQSYSSDDIYTAFTGEGNGKPTEELMNAVNTIKQRYNYDSLSDTDKDMFLYYAMQGAARSIKNPKVGARAVPKGTTVRGDGTVVPTNNSIPQFKGYTAVTTDNGETLYKKNSQYYRATPTENGQYNMTPVTDNVTIGGKVFGQKSGSQPGTLSPVDEQTLIKDFGYHSFSKTTSGTPTTGIPTGYERKEYGDLASIKKWDDVQARVRNYVSSVMQQQGLKNYSFNPNDVVIYIKPKSGDNDYGLIIQIKNPQYKAPTSSNSKKTETGKPKGATLKD